MGSFGCSTGQSLLGEWPRPRALFGSKAPRFQGFNSLFQLPWYLLYRLPRTWQTENDGVRVIRA